MMKRFALMLVVVFSAVSFAAAADIYKVGKTILLGGDGSWDYATIDDSGRFLYLTRATHTMVVDTAAGKLVADISGTTLSHGVALVPAQGRGFISDGRKADVVVFDLKTNVVLGVVPSAIDSDGIIYDAGTNHVFVACGDAAALVCIAADVDVKGGKPEAQIDLGGKPEFLAADGQGRVFVNLTDKAEVAVVDAKAMKVVAKWSMAPGARATGMSIDRENGLLFIGCRNKHMIVMSARDGAILADLPIGSGVDATVFSDGTGLASCGDGTLWAVRETSPGKFETVQTLKTAAGARTMAINKNTGTIYLPYAQLLPTTGPGRPRTAPGTFRVLVVEKAQP